MPQLSHRMNLGPSVSDSSTIDAPHCMLGITLKMVFPVQNSLRRFELSMLFPTILHESLMVLELDWNFCVVTLSSLILFKLHGKKTCLFGNKQVPSRLIVNSNKGWFIFPHPFISTVPLDLQSPIPPWLLFSGPVFNDSSRDSLNHNSILVWVLIFVRIEIVRITMRETTPTDTPPWTIRSNVLITRAAHGGAAWTVMGCSPGVSRR